VGDDAAEAMEETRTKLEEADVLLHKHCSHRRGEFCAFAVGNSHGGGRKVSQLYDLSESSSPFRSALDLLQMRL
jgi:hypothetical protein